MKAMVLAAGLGTRLRPLTDTCPKPLLPLMGQPLLAHVLRFLQQQGVSEVVINMHHQAARLQQWLATGAPRGLRLHLSHETQLLGTAGALKRVAALLRDAPFLVVNADVLIDLDLRAVWHWHRQQQALVTLVVRPDAAARAYGAVLVAASGRVVQISGRPPRPAPAAARETIFTGVQVLSPEVLEAIPATGAVSTTRDVYPALLAAGQAVLAYEHTGYWLDAGVPARYLQAHWDLLAGRRGWGWLAALPAATTVVHAHQPPPHAGLVPPVVLGAGTELAPGARVGPYAVLGAACRVAAGARIAYSVLGDGVQVGAAAHLHGCIVAAGARVPAAATCSGVVA
ncbi:MAG: mannose-1-phosphate guanylyltransferase [Candidatus Tectimicrobiota bacterium]|nr:MAG: mannose-1-phosphate guanylyltransferase [Candidatus Tectomicrobia bacterium]